MDKKKTNSLFFEPVWRENDHFNVYDHQTSTLLLVNHALEIPIPKGVNAVLMQAVDENINYTLTSGQIPTETSGFVLIAGNDPLAIPIGENTKLWVHPAADSARLELQFGRI